MKLAPGTPLSVFLAFDPSTRQPIARLAMEKGAAQLEWSDEVIARALTVSPLKYPPEPGLHAASDQAFNGLHGFLSDSLPEQWGYLVLRKRLAKLGVDIASLSPLDLLALVGSRGRGALVFEPETTPPDDTGSLDLDALAAEFHSVVGRRGSQARRHTGQARWRIGRRPAEGPRRFRRQGESLGRNE